MESYPGRATHNLRLTGAYWFNLTNWYEMSFGANLFYNSGYHYSITMNPPYTYDPDDDDNDIVDPSTWTGYPPYRTSYLHFFVPRGSLELPDHVNPVIS